MFPKRAIIISVVSLFFVGCAGLFPGMSADSNTITITEQENIAQIVKKTLKKRGPYKFEMRLSGKPRRIFVVKRVGKVLKRNYLSIDLSAYPHLQGHYPMTKEDLIDRMI